MKKTEFRCHRKCYYLEKLWSVGEKLWPGAVPNKHFSTDDDFEENAEAAERVPQFHGDDPRHITIMLAELKSKHDIELPDTTTRKEAFLAWQQAEAKAKGITDPIAIATALPKANPPILLEKKFKDMAPDDIDKARLVDMQYTIKAKFGYDVNIVGAKKAAVLKQAIKFEEAALGVMS